MLVERSLTYEIINLWVNISLTIRVQFHKKQRPPQGGAYGIISCHEQLNNVGLQIINCNI